MTTIKIRQGINGFKYSACDADGFFIGNFKKLGDVRKHWKFEIRLGQVQLVRELKEQPDMSRMDATKKAIEAILKGYSKHGNLETK